MLRVISTYIFLFISCAGFTQSYSIYQSLSTNDGLPSNYVFGTCEDVNGFLWVATDKGLARFDGFRWQVWNKDNGLPGNYVTRIFPDGSDGCWMLIPYKGVYHFRNGNATPVYAGDIASSSLSTDQDGALFLEFTSEAGEQVGRLYSPADPKKFTDIFKVRAGCPGGIRANLKEHKIYAFSKRSADLETMRNKVITSWPVVYLALEASYYLKNEDYTIYHISDSVVVNPFYFIRRSGNHETVIPLLSFGRTNGYAHTLFTKKGYYVWNIRSGYYFVSHTMDTTFYSAASGLGSDYVNHIYEAGDGTIIISTLGEGLKLIRNNYRKSFQALPGMVRSIIPDKEDWYLLTANNVIKTRAHANELVALGEVEKSSIQLMKFSDTFFVSSLNVLAIYQEKKAGLRNLRNITFSDGTSHTIRNNGNYLTGTYGAGLLRTSDELDTTKINYPLRIVERLQALPGGFAAMSYEDGVFFTTNKDQVTRQVTTQNGLLSNAVYSVFPDGDTTWVGTANGINAVYNNRVVKTFRFSGSGPTEKALYIFRDKRKKIWTVGNTGLHQLQEGMLVKLSSYPLVDKAELVISAAYNSLTDELGVGSAHSFNIVAMGTIEPLVKVSSPRLLGVWLDNESVNSNDHSLPYDFNSISFLLSPMSASSINRNRVFYRLEGASTEWQEVKDSLQLTFSGLRPGNYILYTKTVNADGYASTPFEMYSFTVLNPFWLRWPFLVSCLMATAFIAFFISRLIERTKQRRKDERLAMWQSVQKERERISKDLHDHLGSNLAIIIAQTDNIESGIEHGRIEEAGRTIRRLSSQTRDTMTVLRETVWAVQETEHPLPEFVIRLRTFLQRLFSSTNITWELKNEAADDLILSPTQTLHLFRIVQEASQNIVKHSTASAVAYLVANRPGRLLISISDNGTGLIDAVAQRGGGISNMQSRVIELNGSIVFESRDGLTIIIDIPL